MYTSAMNVTKNNHCPLGVQSTTLMSESLKPKCGREQDSQPDPLDIKVFSLSSTGVIARERTTINLDCSRELYGNFVLVRHRAYVGGTTLISLQA